MADTDVTGRPGGTPTFGLVISPLGLRICAILPVGSRVVPGWSCATPGGFTPAPDEAGFGSAEAVGSPARANGGGIMPIPKEGGGTT